MKKLSQIFLLFFLNALFCAVHADDNQIFSQPLPDIEKFRCKYCPEIDETVNEKNLHAGAILISNNNAKFSEYRGYDGSAFILDLGYQQQRFNEESYLAVSLDKVGTSNREFELAMGKFGDYQAAINYDQVTRFQFDSTKSPYSGVETNKLTQPLNWTRDSKTSDLLAANDESNSYNVMQRRKNFRLDLKKIFTRYFQLDLQYQFQKKSGVKTLGVAINSDHFGARSIILPEPIDYTTQHARFSASFFHRWLKLEAGYKVSLFKNEYANLMWDNLFDSNTSGESANGQLALDPDNQFHQVYALGVLQPFKWVNAKGQLAIGRMTQNQDFLPYTVNQDLTSAALPQNSLDGKVNTLNANFRLNLKPIRSLSINADAKVDRKDNKTNRTSYSYTALDSEIDSATRTNSPYGYRLYSIGLNGSYYFKHRSSISTGYEYQRKSRTHSEVGLTKTHRAWGKAKYQLNNNNNISAKITKSRRDASNFVLLTKQTDLMRKYYLADKDRTKLSLFMSTLFLEHFSLDVNIDYSTDSYSNSTIGLNDSDDLSYGIDFSSDILDDIQITTFLHREHINSNQSGVDSSNAAWQAKLSDTFTSVGFGLEWIEITDDINGGVKLVYASSAGEISPQKNNTSQAAFPELETNRMTADFFIKYNYKENMSINGHIILEKYSEKDWHYDEVNYASVDHVLGTEQSSNDYFTSLFLVSMNYMF